MLKKRFFIILVFIVYFILGINSCDFDLFSSGISVKNSTNWTISVCFSADKINATGGGWTSISKGSTGKVSVSEGTWYLGIRTDGSNAPSSAPGNSWSTYTIRINDTQPISLIEISFQDGVGASYWYEIKYNNRSIIVPISFSSQNDE